MDSLPKIYDYWHYAFRLKKLLATHRYKIDEKVIFITKDDLNKGRISGPIIEGLTDAVVIPIAALNNVSVFIPLMLEITVDLNGYFTPAKHNSLPIIPLNILDPCVLDPIVLGAKDVFDNYYSTHSPEWLIDGSEPSWQQQLSYAMDLLSNCSHNSWQQNFIEHGYIIDEYNAIIIPANILYENEILDIKDGLVEKVLRLDEGLLKKSQISEITLVEANRGSGKSHYISSMILHDWMLSAITDCLPKACVWLQFENTQVDRYTNIFDCYSDTDVWLTSDIRKEIFSPQIYSDFSISYCLQNFLSQLSNYLSRDIIHLDQAKETLLLELRQEYSKFQDGLSLLKSWSEMSDVLESKYKDKGGIHNRIRNLKYSAGIVKQELRHLSGLSAIWERLFKSSKRLPSWFDSFKLLSYLKNRKLYKFYIQHFPDDKIAILSPQILNAKLNGKIQALKNKEHLISDTLHQSSNELLQLDAVRIKCKNWFKDSYRCPIAIYQQAHDFLNIEIIKKLNFLTLKYHEILVLDNFSWSKSDNKYSKYFISNDIDDIDILCIEHANHISVLDALSLLSKSRQAIILGRSDGTRSNYYPVSLDLELCRFVNLIQDDFDFGYLNSKGILGSVNDLWQFLTKSLHVNHIFNKSYYSKPEVHFINIPSSKQEYLGSKYNSKELDAVNDYLLNLKNESALIEDIAIYTVFAGQSRKMSLMFEGSVFADLPIRLLYNTNVVRSKISIVAIGAVAPRDQSHLVNIKFIENIRSNTSEKLVIICNEAQFDYAASERTPSVIISAI